MGKSVSHFLKIIFLLSVGIYAASCKDDEEVRNPTVSFVDTEAEVNEDQSTSGLFEISIQLDKAAPADLTIEYNLGGTAFDSISAFNDGIPSSYYDYYVNGVSGKLQVPAGQSAANIEIQLYSDFRFEDDETIEITLSESAGAQIGTNNKHTITLQQQDGKVVALVWGDDYTDVDMDMFLWTGDETTVLQGVIATAINEGVSPKQEIIFIPSVFTADITEAAFGLSYVYYTGSANPMNFEAQFADFANGELEAEADRDVYAASYTLDNINAWDETEIDPAIVQTFRIVNGAYVDITEITVPASGSRIKTHKLPQGLERRTARLSRPL